MRPALLSYLLAAGCVTAPEWVRSDDYPALHAPRLAPASRGYREEAACQLRPVGGLSADRVAVIEGRALVLGISGEGEVAYLDGNFIICTGLVVGNRCGEVREGRLAILGGPVSAPIAGGEVRFPGALTDTVYGYTPACSQHAAALGALALHVLDHDRATRQAERAEEEKTREADKRRRDEDWQRRR
jgi:hypothetical protein